MLHSSSKLLEVASNHLCYQVARKFPVPNFGVKLLDELLATLARGKQTWMVIVCMSGAGQMGVRKGCGDGACTFRSTPRTPRTAFASGATVGQGAREFLIFLK